VRVLARELAGRKIFVGSRRDARQRWPLALLPVLSGLFLDKFADLSAARFIPQPSRGNKGQGARAAATVGGIDGAHQKKLAALIEGFSILEIEAMPNAIPNRLLGNELFLACSTTVAPSQGLKAKLRLVAYW
jgi:hypothetical protein